MFSVNKLTRSVGFAWRLQMMMTPSMVGSIALVMVIAFTPRASMRLFTRDMDTNKHISVSWKKNVLLEILNSFWALCYLTWIMLHDMYLLYSLIYGYWTESKVLIFKNIFCFLIFLPYKLVKILSPKIVTIFYVSFKTLKIDFK